MSIQIRMTDYAWNGTALLSPGDTPSLDGSVAADLVNGGKAMYISERESNKEMSDVKANVDPVTGRIELVAAGGVIPIVGPSYLYANLPAASSNAGNTVRVTDVGPSGAGSLWISDGTIWRPLNGQVVLAHSSSPKGTIPSSVTSGTYNQPGTTALTVTAAGHGLTVANNGKMLHAVFTSGDAPSGHYPFSYADANTFVLTMPAAATTSGNVTLEGANVDRTLATISIPAGCMGEDGRIEVETCWSYQTSGNTKTFAQKFGGTFTFHTQTTTTSNLMAFLAGFANAGAANAQKQVNTPYGGGLGATSASIATAAIDTTAAQDITIVGKSAAVNEYLQLESYKITLVR